MRRGQRAGTATVVVHVAVPEPGDPDGRPVRMGLVVGRTVGTAVKRNQVKRRLRPLLRDRLDVLPDGSVLVVRALPAAAGASSADLARDLDAALHRALRRLADRGGAR